MNQAQIDTVRLLLAVAPAVFRGGRFAMKGGTALNLFVHDMPRLSVDIDVAFTDHRLAREEALRAISDDLRAAQRLVLAKGYRADIVGRPEGEEVRMLVRSRTTQVKVEVNGVFRGTVLPLRAADLAASAQELFATTVTVPVLETPELYGGKLVAAMDRQHPRDLFDVREMFARHNLPPAFVDCFVAYLAGHNRPVHEVLFPRTKEIGPLYRSDFFGMTKDDVPLDELKAIQTELPRRLQRALGPQHRDFLLSLVRLEPRWDLLPFPHLIELPAIRWKLVQLEKLRAASKRRFEEQQQALEEGFNH